MKPLKRYVEPVIINDLTRKMVFLAGPRQTGKTTVAKELIKRANRDITTRYLNWDSGEDRENILQERFPADDGILVLDEIHKYRRWRQLVKGLYDKRGERLQILVTGSARLDHYRHGGDSLQGRYHFHRLHPLSFAEISGSSQADLEDLLAYSGFPEPFFLASATETRRWSREYRTRMVIEELQVAHQTVARWVQILENLYMIFRIYPFGSPKIRAVKKEAKHYHADWTVIHDQGARFENLIACHLLKWCHFLQDTEGRDLELRYFRDMDRREWIS